MLLNDDICRFVLVLLCVGDLVRLGLSSIRVAGWSTRCVEGSREVTDILHRRGRARS